ncbi:MAG: extracellular solute-binding protein [Oscillospiraceae bacterium]|nr:extracellular solute-binding protein [Oscillospiraceae bacterium]
MKTKFWAAILLSAAALAALVGCAADGTAGESAESGKTEITLGAWYYSSAESWAPLVEKFNEENESYEIEVVSYVSSDERTLRRDLEAGEAPDLLCLYGFGLIERAYLEDLTPYMEEVRESFIPAVLNGIEQNAPLKALPLLFEMDTQVYCGGEAAAASTPLQGISRVWNLSTLYGEDYDYIYGSEENDIDFTKTAFAITADSGCKDGAWAFIEFALRDESQLALAGFSAFPVTQSAFDELCTQALAGGIAGGWGFELAQSDIEKLSLLVDGTEEYLWCF